jgi:hypothetical protein
MICPHCGNQYYPEQDFHVLCYECFDEVGMIGDSPSYRMWKAVSLLLNEELERTDLEELANGHFMKFVEEVLDEMDLVMRAKWILQQAEKYVK